MTSFAQVPDFKTLSSQRLCCSLPMSMSKGRRKSFLMNDVSEVRDWKDVHLRLMLTSSFSGRGGGRLKGWRRRWKSPASSCAEVEIMAFQFSVNPIWNISKKNRGNWLGCMSSDNTDLKTNIQECSTVPAPHCDPWQSARLPQVGDFFSRGQTDETKWRQV